MFKRHLNQFMVEKWGRFINCLATHVVVIVIAFIGFFRRMSFTMVQQNKVMLLTAYLFITSRIVLKILYPFTQTLVSSIPLETNAIKTNGANVHDRK